MKDWKSILIPPDTSILRSIEIINATAMQIALVAGPDNLLLGTVTDGDIRRGILQGTSLESPVEAIMHRTPVVAGLNDAPEKILALMKLKVLRHIPVLDDAGRVVRMETLDEFAQVREFPNRVILMAGGMGTRLRPLTEHCPKPLIHVGNRPILATIVDNFIACGFRHFYLSVHYKAEMIESYFGDGSALGVEIRYVHEDRPLGTAGPLGLLPEKPTLPVVVMNGDILTRVNFQHLLAFHAAEGAKATMCVREFDYQVPYGVARLERDRLVGIEEKPTQHFLVNAGIYVLDPEALELIPGEGPYDMPELFRSLIAAGLHVAAYPIREYWLDVGRLDDLERANGEFREVFA